MKRARFACTAALCAVVGLACQSSPPPAPPAPGDAPARRRSFDTDRAWEHLATFSEIGPRVMGTEGAAEARRYITTHLKAVGLQVEEQGVSVMRDGQEPLELRNVAAVIPGSSTDVILLIASFDTRPYTTFRHEGVNEGGSGAAVLLELARVLSKEPLPYRTWFVFLEGEAATSSDPLAESSLFGSRALAQRLSQMEAVPHIRVGVVIDRVCDPDLEIARDLRSHRIYREEFWRAAARVGAEDAFPRRSGFQSPRSAQEVLAGAGLRRVVTLSDTSFGGGEPPGAYAGTPDDDLEHCSPKSLETIGRVTLEALDAISVRLARIDRFSEAPVAGAEAVRLEHLRGDDPPQTGDEAPATDVQESDDEPQADAGAAAETP